MGRMIVRTLLSVVDMKRDMIIERTQSGKVFAKNNITLIIKRVDRSHKKKAVTQQYLSILKHIR